MRPRFSSQLATVLTMVGVAVGLGNVWRFPYMMGRFGGSAFLLVYLAFVAAFAVPALMAEWALGRATRQGPLGALVAAFGPCGRWPGWLLLFTVLVATSYYTVVVANVAYTAGFSLLRGFDSVSQPAFEAGLGDGLLQAVVSLLLVGSVLLVLRQGLRRGIERLSKLVVPLATLALLYLVVSALLLPGAMDHLLGFLRPDFGSLTATSVFAAMGQAFFSLSLGGTFYVIYGSYLRDAEPIPGSALLTALGDVGAALLAGAFVVPATLAFGLDMATGPRLLFETLPRLFAAVAAGRLMGGLFLLALSTMAYLSVLAAFEVLIGGLRDRFQMAPARALLVIGGLELLLIVPVAFHPELIAPLDLLFGSGMQCLGSAIALVALAWGLGAATTGQQIFGSSVGFWPRFYLAWIRFVVPAALLLALALFVVDSL